MGRSLSGRPFGWFEDLNYLTCAGPRSGKGISTVVPNLLLYPGSALVVDPKGELAELTAAYRKDKLGHKVIVLDPAGVADIPDDLRGTFNPLGALNAYSDKDVVSAAQTIAQGIVVPEPAAGKDPFWDKSALNFIQGVILYILKKFPPEDRTLMKLRETVASGDIDLFEEFVAAMREDDPEFEADYSLAQSQLLDNMTAMKEFGGVVREAATKIKNFGDQTRGNVLGNAMTNLDFLNDPRLWENLVHSEDPETTFALSEFRSQEQFLTVYLCLPTDMMQEQGRWLRLICSQVIQYIERTKFDKDKDLPVLMMIDEFFQLGRFPSIVNTLTYAPGFGLRLWLIVQDLNQLKINYPKEWETILGACGVKQFFGINELTTAKYLSELIGEGEVDVPTITMTRNESETSGKTSSKTEGVSRTVTHGSTVTDTVGTSSSHTSGQTTTDSVADTVGSTVAS